MGIDRNKLRLNHILEATRHIAEFLVNVSKDEFESDYEKQSAVIRQIEIIGEAASKLSREFTDSKKQVDWPRVIGMRHKMIHDYFEVEVSIVWETIQNDVPKLRNQIEEVIKS